MRIISVFLKQRGLGAALLCCLLSVILSLRHTAAQTQRVPSPAGFTVLVNGQNFGTFSRVSGLPENEVVLGGNRAEPGRTVGRAQPGFVTLSGCNQSCISNFNNWFQLAQRGSTTAYTVTILVPSAGGRQSARYELTNAVPRSVSTGALNAGSRTPGGTVQLAYGAIRKVQ